MSEDEGSGHKGISNVNHEMYVGHCTIGFPLEQKRSTIFPYDSIPPYELICVIKA